MSEKNQALTAVILAAGKGTRMNSGVHKALHPLGGQPMLSYILSELEALQKITGWTITRYILVGDKSDQLTAAYPAERFIYQDKQLGTGHAVMTALSSFEDPKRANPAGKDLPSGDSDEDILVLFADTPLITSQILREMIEKKNPDLKEIRDPEEEMGTRLETGVVVLGFNAENPEGYGRLLKNDRNQLDRIIEHRDASPSERALTLCNSGVMLIDGKKIGVWLRSIRASKNTGEYYLTDIVAIARSDGYSADLVEASEDDTLGVNSRSDLARVEAVFQHKMRLKAMQQGVTLIAPETVFFSYDTQIAQDVTIEPHVFLGVGVVLDQNVTVKAYSYLEECHVKSGASIGPFARLRPGADIGPDAHIGNFVEIKKSTLESGVKVGHLSYIGDTYIGQNTNIGAGTITCNYNGVTKAKTRIGQNSFIGSNSALIAPLTIGDGALIAAGSTLADDVPSDALAINRAEQKIYKEGANRFRQRRKTDKS